MRYRSCFTRPGQCGKIIPPPLPKLLLKPSCKLEGSNNAHWHPYLSVTLYLRMLRFLDISESVSETLHRSYLFWQMSAFYLPKNPSLLPFACSCHREKVKLVGGQVTHFCCYLTHIFDFLPSHCQDNAQKLRNRKIHCCKWKVEELVDVSWKARFI